MWGEPMGVIDFVVLAVILAILAGCVFFIRRSKKKGKACIGCPDSCCHAQNGCAGCKGCR